MKIIVSNTGGGEDIGILKGILDRIHMKGEYPQVLASLSNEERLALSQAMQTLRHLLQPKLDELSRRDKIQKDSPAGIFIGGQGRE